MLSSTYTSINLTVMFLQYSQSNVVLKIWYLDTSVPVSKITRHIEVTLIYVNILLKMKNSYSCTHIEVLN